MPRALRKITQNDAHQDDAAENQVGGAPCFEDVVEFASDQPGPFDLPPQVVGVSVVVHRHPFRGLAESRPDSPR